MEQGIPKSLFRFLQAAQKDLKAGRDTSLEGSLVSQIASITMALAELDPKGEHARNEMLYRL